MTGLAVSAAAFADEGAIQLKAAAGRELVSIYCASCHSLDYIPMNAGILNREGWRKTVDKMIRSMGAHIEPDDVAPIVDYLAKNYGR